MTYTRAKAALGFRSWNIAYNKDRQEVLLPLFQGKDVAWKPGINRARCVKVLDKKEPHGKIPANDCDCGWHAFHEIHSLLIMYVNTKFDVHWHGAIAGSGRVEIHSEGWRSEEAQLIALYCHINKYVSQEEKEVCREEIESVSKYYQVPVFENLKEFYDYIYSEKVLNSAEKIPKKERPSSSSIPGPFSDVANISFWISFIILSLVLAFIASSKMWLLVPYIFAFFFIAPFVKKLKIKKSKY